MVEPLTQKDVYSSGIIHTRFINYKVDVIGDNAYWINRDRLREVYRDVLEHSVDVDGIKYIDVGDFKRYFQKVCEE